jgi:phage major head subunit gpT-like protein
MPTLTPQFLFDFESNMQAIVENEYARLTKNLWWQRIAKVRTTDKLKEVVAWLLSTAKIEGAGEGGSMRFDDIVSTYTTYTNQFATAGIKIRRAQLEDLDGNGMAIGAKWSSDIGAYMAYWPQKQIVSAMKLGSTSAFLSYDAQNFFSASHPLNPYDLSVGYYSNLITSKDISTAVTLDVAFENLSAVISTIASVKMPNGEDPRFLVPRTIICPTKLFPRAVQLTKAKFLAQAAGTTGGGAGDISAVISAWGWDMPIEAQEFNGWESDTTYFVACEEMSSSQLGAMVYVNREPFRINYYTGQGGGTGVDAILNRADELEYHCVGRNVVGGGHPYLLYKVTA